MGCRVQGFGFQIMVSCLGSGFRVSDLGFGFQVSGVGFDVEGLRGSRGPCTSVWNVSFRVQDFGSGVEGCN